MQAANNTRIVTDAVKAIGEYTGAKGFPCKSWVSRFQHLCESFRLPAGIQRQTFAACMEGDALRWFRGLDEQIKADLDELIENLYLEFVPTTAFQGELEKELHKLVMTEGNDVGQYSREFQLIIDQMDEPPTQQKQLAKFK